MTIWADMIYGEDVKFTTPLPDKSFLASFPKDIRILDVGCGYGRVLSYLQSLGFTNLTGFDMSPSYVLEAKKNCQDANLFVSDFKSLNLNKKYDLILLMGVIEYILTDNDQDAFFRKISRSLSINGSVLLETFIIDFKQNWKQYIFVFIKTLHFGRFKNSKGFECHHQSINNLRMILQKYFIIESEAGKCYVTWTKNYCRGHNFNLRKK
jgi:2-polyprenyl-3-methyl-5-hydroxy-6-metoxy-1,4-benzoquinol methylase